MSERHSTFRNPGKGAFVSTAPFPAAVVLLRHRLRNSLRNWPVRIRVLQPHTNIVILGMEMKQSSVAIVAFIDQFWRIVSEGLIHLVNYTYSDEHKKTYSSSNEKSP